MGAPVIHTITYWKSNGFNEFNENSFDDPVEVTAFWIDDEKLSKDSSGEDYMSMARILCNEKIFNKEDRVQFTELADADFNESYVVKRTKFVENRRQTTQLFTAMLGRSK